MKIKIEKNIYVRDKYKVRRQAFAAGTEVERSEYDAVLSSNAVVNPEDLPTAPQANKTAKRSLASLEVKDLAVKPTESVVRSEEAVKEVEKEAEPVAEKPVEAPKEEEVEAPKEVEKPVKKVEPKPKKVKDSE